METANRHERNPRPADAAPEALFFDVFGTCVDWRTSIAREGAELGRRLGIRGIDWAAFADAWRAQYQPRMEAVRGGARPWVPLDLIHREGLDQILADFGLHTVADIDRAELADAWRRLDPWPDVVASLHRLRSRFILAPCSNGNLALMTRLARHAGLPWDVILGAEIARAYKPRPAVYLASAAALGLAPHQVLMVAAHNDDLAAAASCGFRTAFVPRPTEHGPGQNRDLRPATAVDVVAADFLDLADQLGC